METLAEETRWVVEGAESMARGPIEDGNYMSGTAGRDDTGGAAGEVRIKLWAGVDGKISVLPTGDSSMRWARCNITSLGAVVAAVKAESLSAMRAALEKALRKRWPEHTFRVRALRTVLRPKRCAGCEGALGKIQVSCGRTKGPCPPDLEKDIEEVA